MPMISPTSDNERQLSAVYVYGLFDIHTYISANLFVKIVLRREKDAAVVYT